LAPQIFRKTRWFAASRPLLPALALSGALLLTSGCRRAAVEQFDPSVETRVTITDPAVYVRPQSNTGEKDPWYRELQVVLDKPAASEQELNAKLDEEKPRVNEGLKKLLDDVAAAVQSHKNPSDKWSVLAISCGKTKKVGDLQLTADVGLTRLYAKRPVIAFNDLPLELCIAKLSREAGLQESQPRGYNPQVNWSQTNVSVLEAFETVLSDHGFEHKLSDSFYKAAVRVQDFASRQEFVDGASAAILLKGKNMNAARPAILVTHKEKPAPPPPPAEPVKKTVPIAGERKK